MLFQKNKITSLCDNYYNKVIKNFSKKNFFYIITIVKFLTKLHQNKKLKKFIKFLQPK